MPAVYIAHITNPLTCDHHSIFLTRKVIINQILLIRDYSLLYFLQSWPPDPQPPGRAHLLERESACDFNKKATSYLVRWQLYYYLATDESSSKLIHPTSNF